MTGACLIVGTAMLHLASPVFVLTWTHSIERVEWQETWEIGEERLTLVASAVKGSGAGMEPGPDAYLVDGWWVSSGGLSVESLRLAASGATEGGWTLCSGETGRLIGAEANNPILIAPCGSKSGLSIVEHRQAEEVPTSVHCLNTAAP